MKILCGAEVLNFDNVPENLFDLDALIEELQEEYQLRPSETLSVDEIQRIVSNNFVGAKSVNITYDLIEEIKEEDQEEQNNTLPTVEEAAVSFVRRAIKNGVDITAIKTDRSFNQIESSLEFLISSLSNSFDLKPIQSVGLLTNHNHYLIAACVKGIKGGKFQPIVSWYETLNYNVVDLCSLIIDEFEALKDDPSQTKMLDAFASGFHSSFLPVLVLTFQLMTKALSLFQKNELIAELAFKWFFSSEEGGYKLALGALNRVPECAQMIVELCKTMCQVGAQVAAMFKDELLNHTQNVGQYIRYIADLFPFIQQQIDQQMVEESGLLQYWIDNCSRQADNDGKHSLEDRISALSLLTDIWLSYTQFVDSKAEMGNTILSMLKRSARERTRSMRIVSAASLFTLLDSFALTKNQSAPVIYKALVFSLVENPSDPTMREFYLTNFTAIFKKYQNIPIGLLVEPLIKQLVVQLGVTVFLKTFDMDFFLFLTSHPKLTVSVSVPLMNLLSKLCLAEISFGTSAINPYILLVERYSQTDPQITTSIINFVCLCMQSLFEILISQTGPENKTQTSRLRHSSQGKFSKNLSEEQFAVNTLKTSLIAEIIQRIQAISDESLNESIRYCLLEAQEKIKTELHTKSKAIENLLEFYSDQIVFTEIKDELGTALVPFNPKNSKDSLASQLVKHKAMVVIYQIQQQKTDKEESRRLEEVRANAFEQRRRTQLKKQIDKRRIELGVVAQVFYPESQELVLFKENDLQAVEKKQRVQWIDIDEEEEFEKGACAEIMKRFSKLWRNLFGKYCNIGHKTKALMDRGNFDGLKNLAETMSLAEMIKLLKDHNSLPELLQKQDVTNLFRIVNTRLQNSQLTAVDFKGFQVLVQQTAFNAFNDCSPSERLGKLINRFKQASVAKGMNVLLYEDQDTGTEFIEALNTRVVLDPSYILPEGFQKVKQQNQVYTYEVPAQLLEMMGQSRVISMQLVDDLMHELFGFHFLEPIISYQETIKVKQVLQKPNIKGKAEALSYMKNLERNQKPKILFDPKPLTINNINAKVTLPTKLRLMVSDSSAENRVIVEEAAQTLELMLQTVEKGAPQLKVNQAVLQKLSQGVQEQRLAKQREVKRVERNASVKKDLELNKAVKEDKTVKLIEERKQREQREQEIQKRKQDGARADIVKIIIEAQQRKDQIASIQAQKQPLKENKEKVQAQQLAFRQKSKSHLKQEVKKLAELKTLVANQQVDTSLKESAMKDALRRKTELMLAANKDQRFQSEKWQSQINSFLEQPDVVYVIETQFGKQLDRYFKFYCQQGKLDLSLDLQFRLQNLHFKEFVKFGFQSKVVPVLITADELVGIFRTVSKLANGSIGNDQSSVQFINLNGFKNSLVRIAICGHEKLGGLSEEQISLKVSSEQSRRDSDSKVKESTKKKEMERKQLQDQVVAEMRQEWEEKQKKTKQVLSKSQSSQLTISQSESSIGHRAQNSSATSAREEPEFQKWMRQQENIGNGISKMMEDKRHATTISSSDGDIEHGRGLFKSKKMGAQKIIEKLENTGALNDRLAKFDLRDNRQVTREMDVNLISASTVDCLLRFIGLEPGEVTPAFDAKLNQQRIEIQGQKPQSRIKELKKNLLPPKLVVIRERDDEHKAEKQVKKRQQPERVSVAFDHAENAEVAQTIPFKIEVSESIQSLLQDTQAQEDENSAIQAKRIKLIEQIEIQKLLPIQSTEQMEEHKKEADQVRAEMEEKIANQNIKAMNASLIKVEVAQPVQESPIKVDTSEPKNLRVSPVKIAVSEPHQTQEQLVQIQADVKVVENI